MADRPILFQGPMVRALLAGTKTQTRRVCKNKVYSNGFHFDGREILCHNDYLPPSAMLMDVKRGKVEYTTSNLEGWDAECPYGQPGDRLWVRESHWWFVDECDPVTGYFPPKLTADDVEYRADGEVPGRIWRPSIHMPRWASRITLEITAVRVEKLQDISEADALAEGAPGYEEGVDAPPPEDDYEWSYYASFMRLWDSINAPREPKHIRRRRDKGNPVDRQPPAKGATSWDANPWVWVVEFKRVTP